MAAQFSFVSEYELLGLSPDAVHQAYFPLPENAQNGARTASKTAA